MNARLLSLFVFVATLLALVGFSNWNQEAPHVSGVIEADEIRLGSRVGGRVSKVHVEEGQHVAAGEVLVELEPYDLLEREREVELSLAANEAEYERFVAGFRNEEIGQAKAYLEQLQARYDLLKAGPRAEEITAAQGRLTLAEAQMKLAEKEYDRFARLAESSATSQQQLDAAREAFETASAQLIVQQQELALLEAGTREEELREAAAAVEQARMAWELKQHGYRSEEIAQAKAARDAAQAKLAAIRKQKDELNIKSPIEGTIEAIELQPGDIVAPSAPVLSILEKNRLWVRTYIPQSRVAVRVGDRLPVTIDSYPEEKFVGVVTFVAREAEFTPSNIQTPEERSKLVFRVKLTVENKNDLLRPGMITDVWLDEIGENQ